MRILQYKQLFLNELQPTYDIMEAESFFYIALEDWLHLKRIDLALQPELEFTAEQLLQWDQLKQQLLQQQPIQYIIGHTEFMGLQFQVTPATLIPRPETEELVMLILNQHPQCNGRILDIGTGSGCIAISLAHSLPNAQVMAIDVSPQALEIATANATRNNVSVDFLLKDILLTEQLDFSCDLIVSNPPYVRNLEKVEIQLNVLEHEPHLALFVSDEDPLLFYRKIAQLAQKSLLPNGKLYFEINQYLGRETADLLVSLGYTNVVLHKDCYNNDRMLSAVWK